MAQEMAQEILRAMTEIADDGEGIARFALKKHIFARKDMASDFNAALKKLTEDGELKRVSLHTFKINKPATTQQRASATKSSPDLPDLFSSNDLGKYTELFQQQEIDMTTFLTLTEEDLRNLGISTFGARRKMLNAIA